MAVKTRDQEPEGPVEWLENELRDTKARLHKVEGELEQALKQLWSMEAGVRRLTEASSVVRRSVGHASPVCVKTSASCTGRWASCRTARQRSLIGPMRCFASAKRRRP